MDFSKINIKNCPCGQTHTEVDISVNIGEGFIGRVGEFLTNFPRELLIVADKNTLAASEGILNNLESAGFNFSLQVYDNCTEANIREVKKIEELECEAILAVGSGSIGDICRLAAFNKNKKFAIFATAPSMDGFASSVAPITVNNIKENFLCRPPSVIIADTNILAKSPNKFKSAGFGDIMAKYIALAEWKIAHIITGEPYCETIASIMNDALQKTVAIADSVTSADTKAAAALMEALTLAGVVMARAGHTRPAAAIEHLIAHFWENEKLSKGLHSAFHGEKVGVATLLAAKLYGNLINGVYGMPRLQEDNTNWEEVYAAYPEAAREFIRKQNEPSPLNEIDKNALLAKSAQIANIIKTEISYENINDLLKRAGCKRHISEIDIDEELAISALKYHAYSRRALHLTRLFPILGINPDYRALLN